MKSLYIFATSERPDAYINTLAYAIEHLQITEIYIIVISEHDYAEEIREDNLLASTVVSNISTQLHALSRGQYIEKWENLNTRTTVSLLNQETHGVYERCLKAINESGTTGKVIPISDLDNKLNEYLSKSTCIIDVSALKKNLLIDVVATLLSIEFIEVYSFELKKKPTFNQSDLYHNLRHHDDYIFRNLAVSDSVKKSLGRIGKWSATAKTIMIFTAILAVISITLGFIWKDSTFLSTLNIISMMASISSYLFLFVRDKK